MDFYKGDTVEFTAYSGQRLKGIVQKHDELVTVYIREIQKPTRIRPERAELIKPVSGNSKRRKTRGGAPSSAIKRYRFAMVVGTSESATMMHRQWGLVVGENQRRYSVRLYTGAIIKPLKRLVTVYNQPPSNWKKLFEEGERTLDKVKKKRNAYA